MQKSAILITGANGEMGRGLIQSLADNGKRIITLDLQPISDLSYFLCYSKVFI